MSGMLSDKEIAELVPSELVPTNTPIPTQIVSSDEFYPDPQNEKQREVEARLLDFPGNSGHMHCSPRHHNDVRVLKFRLNFAQEVFVALHENVPDKLILQM